jgi:hypothetical protein
VPTRGRRRLGEGSVAHNATARAQVRARRRARMPCQVETIRTMSATLRCPAPPGKRLARRRETWQPAAGDQGGGSPSIATARDAGLRTGVDSDSWHPRLRRALR